MFVSCHEMFVSYVMKLLIVRKFSVAVLHDNPNSLSSCTLTVGFIFTTVIQSLLQLFFKWGCFSQKHPIYKDISKTIIIFSPKTWPFIRSRKLGTNMLITISLVRAGRQISVLLMSHCEWKYFSRVAPAKVETVNPEKNHPTLQPHPLLALLVKFTMVPWHGRDEHKTSSLPGCLFEKCATLKLWSAQPFLVVQALNAWYVITFRQEMINKIQ